MVPPVEQLLPPGVRGPPPLVIPYRLLSLPKARPPYGANPSGYHPFTESKGANAWIIENVSSGIEILKTVPVPVLRNVSTCGPPSDGGSVQIAVCSLDELAHRVAAVSHVECVDHAQRAIGRDLVDAATLGELSRHRRRSRITLHSKP